MINENDFVKKQLDKSFTYPSLYVHNCFSSMFHGILNWISSEFYPRFNYKVITTYDKAVEFFNKKIKNPDGEVQTAVLPCVSLDPVLDFSNEERAGRFLWMFENYDPLHGKYLFPQINLKEQGVTITPVFSRYQGTAELTFWFESIYELIDFRVKLIQYCGGYGRWIRPKFFWTHLILPKELIEFEGPEGKLDWSATNEKIIQLETTNTKEYAYPFLLNSIWKLDSFGDSSTKMGGEQVSEWKLSASFTWEAMIPTFIRLDNYEYEDIQIKSTIGTAQTYTAQPLITGVKLLQKLSNVDGLKNYLKSICCIHNIEDNGETPIIKFDDSMCRSYPTEYQPYNHYVCGKVVLLNFLKSPDDITDKNTILVFERYLPQYDPYLRKCKGAISRYDTVGSEFYNFCVQNRLSFMYNIKEDNIYNILKNLHGKIVTFDPIGQMIYSGSRNIIKYDSMYDKNELDEKFVFNDNLLKMINRYNLRNELDSSDFILESSNVLSTGDLVDKICEISNPKEKRYELPYIISKDMNIEILINDKKLMKHEFFIENQQYLILKNSDPISSGDIIYLVRKDMSITKTLNLYCDYAITRQDEKNYYIDKKYISIDVPKGTVIDDVICCSYMGKLEPYSEYILKDDKLYFHMEPMRDRVIQVFLYQPKK